MASKTIYLIRHGETGHANENRFYGSTDLPLSETGREQARALRPWLAGRLGVNFRAVASPRRRALETLQEALPGTPPVIDPDLREMDFGQCEGLTLEEIEARFPALLRLWVGFSPKLTFPGGENLGEYLARIRRAAARLSGGPGETLAVFSHGGVIRSLICRFLRVPFRAQGAFQLPCAGAAVVTVSDGYGVLSELGQPACIRSF